MRTKLFAHQIILRFHGSYFDISVNVWSKLFPKALLYFRLIKNVRLFDESFWFWSQIINLPGLITKCWKLRVQVRYIDALVHMLYTVYGSILEPVIWYLITNNFLKWFIWIAWSIGRKGVYDINRNELYLFLPYAVLVMRVYGSWKKKDSAFRHV